jgi:DNA-directed RNA polymerase III subunit RPC6
MSSSSSSSSSQKIGTKILKYLKKRGECTSEKLLEKMGNEVLDPLNALMRTGKIQVHQIDGKTYFRLPDDPERMERMRGLSAEDNLVLQLIQDSGNKGIWVRSLKLRSGLQQTQMTRSLKALEQREMIKSIKTMSNRSRKVYMLAELTPDRSLVGGPWISDNNQFDTGFFTALQECVVQLLTDNDQLSADELHNLIANSGVTLIKLTKDDTSALVATLVYDGRVQSFTAVDDELAPPITFYRLDHMDRNARVEALTTTPCAFCPVYDQCTDNGPISPITCPYLDEWIASDKDNLVLLRAHISDDDEDDPE